MAGLNSSALASAVTLLKSLPQPCAAFDGRCCRIYAARPKYCQAFDCALLQQVKAGLRTETTAISIIRRTRKATGEIRGLLRRLGNTDETAPLAARFEQVTRCLEANPPAKEMAWLYSQLTTQMHELRHTLEWLFYPGTQGRR